MSDTEFYLALSILCLLIAAGFYIYEDIRRLSRKQVWRHEWPIAQSRPYDREDEAA